MRCGHQYEIVTGFDVVTKSAYRRMCCVLSWNNVVNFDGEGTAFANVSQGFVRKSTW